MKKLQMLMITVLATLAFGAHAWTLTVPKTNATATTVMVVPPVRSIPADLSMIPERSTNVAVAAGAVYRIGGQLIVAAHAGNITNQQVTTTAYYTNGIAVNLAAAQYAATNSIPVYTNSYTEVAPISVPAFGISGYDGTVRWYRARTAAYDDVRMQITVGGGSVTLTDASGNALVYSTTAEKDFTGFDGTLYISQSDLSTNSVSIMVW